MPNTLVFRTIGTDLVNHAEQAYEYFRNAGYTLTIEPFELAYPKIPVLRGKRHHTTILIEVTNKPDMKLLKNWAAYGKASGQDTRISICVPEDAVKSRLAKHQLEIIKLGIGIYISNVSELRELSSPHDMNINLVLPDRSSLSLKVKKILGDCYEQIDRGQWREGFEAACKGLESQARAYFIRAINRTRLTVFDERGRARNPTLATMRRYTMGQLAGAFEKARPHNAIDSRLYKTLEAINKDRIGIVHKPKTQKTEKNLRKNVSLHIITIIQALESMV